MNRNLFWCVMSFFGGCFVGGWLVERQCTKKHRRVVEELQDEVDQLIVERYADDSRGLLDAHRGIVEASAGDVDDAGDILDEEYDFDDPFEEVREVSRITAVDKVTGKKLEFRNMVDFIDYVDPDVNLRQNLRNGELMTRILEGDTDAYKELTKRYSSEKIDEIIRKHDHPRDSGEDEYDPDDIYLISPDTFKQEVKYRDDETITYYQQDGVLINSADQLISNQERCIGREALDEVGTTDKDYLYVDNQVENKVYEIFIDHRYSYYRDVLNSGAGE